MQGFQSCFYPGDLVTLTGDREICSVSGRVPDYPGELACVQLDITLMKEAKVIPLENILSLGFLRNCTV